MSRVNSKPILHRSDVIWSHCSLSQQPIYHLLNEIKLMWMDTTVKSCNVMYPQIVFSSRIVNVNRVRPCNSSLQICNVECDKSLPRQPKLKSHWDFMASWLSAYPTLTPLFRVRSPNLVWHCFIKENRYQERTTPTVITKQGTWETEQFGPYKMKSIAG